MKLGAVSAAVACGLVVWFCGAAAVLGFLPESLLPLLASVAIVSTSAALLWRRWSVEARAIALATALGLLFSVANGRSMTAPDTQPASEQPWNLLRHATLLLDGTPALAAHPHAHWIYRRPDGSHASWYPPGMALLAAPVYLPTLLATAPSEALLSQFEKLAAALLNAGAILLLGLSLRRAGSSARWIFIGCTLYGLCGSALSIQSQALWQHTGVALALGLVLLASVDAEGRGASALGYAAGLIATIVRPPDLLLLLPFLSLRSIAQGLSGRRLALAVFLGIGSGAALFGVNNWLLFGAPWRVGYLIGQGHLGFTFSELPESLVGLLVSPAHGLLIFVPWLLLLPLVPLPEERTARAALSSGLLLLCLMSCWWCWWGAEAFGPRMLAEAQLPLAFAAARAGPAMSVWSRRTLAALALAGFATHASYLFVLSRDASFHADGAWSARAHPVGHWLSPGRRAD